jgi:hypothetical protein
VANPSKLKGATMKKLVTVEEVQGEGLEALMGENVLLMCANYFYTGKLVGVNTDFVKLEKPSIVYETGAWSTDGYQDSQRLNADEWYVTRSAIESYGVSK